MNQKEEYLLQNMGLLPSIGGCKIPDFIDFDCMGVGVGNSDF